MYCSPCLAVESTPDWFALGTHGTEQCMRIVGFSGKLVEGSGNEKG